MSHSNPTDSELSLYAEHYVLHGDQTKAWRNAFPKSKAKPETQHVKASEFHSQDKVKIRIEELKAISNKQSEERFEVTVADIKKRLLKIASMGVAENVDKDGNIKPAAASAAVSALAELNKMDGNHAAIKTDNTHNFSDKSDEELEKIIAGR